MAICPLCGSEAKQFGIIGDHITYDCPNDTTFDISASIAKELENRPDRRQSKIEYIRRSRKRGEKGVVVLR